jgi:hypothetical protein
MGKSNSQYIHNVARTIMGQLGVRREHLVVEAGIAQTLYRDYGEKVNSIISKWSPETLGKVAACGTGRDSVEKRRYDLYSVHCGTYLNKYDDGRTLLLVVATTAIIAAMADIVKGLTTSSESETRSSGMPIPHSSRYTSL